MRALSTICTYPRLGQVARHNDLDAGDMATEAEHRHCLAEHAAIVSMTSSTDPIKRAAGRRFARQKRTGTPTVDQLHILDSTLSEYVPKGLSAFLARDGESDVPFAKRRKLFTLADRERCGKAGIFYAFYRNNVRGHDRADPPHDLFNVRWRAMTDQGLTSVILICVNDVRQ